MHYLRCLLGSPIISHSEPVRFSVTYRGRNVAADKKTISTAVRSGPAARSAQLFASLFDISDKGDGREKELHGTVLLPLQLMMIG